MGINFNFPTHFKVPLVPDDDGMTGRECPVEECKGYFKVEFGTGLEGEGLPCYCPYCGFKDDHDQFFTPEQIEYAKSIVAREFDHALRRELKKLEFNIPAKGPFGIGISMKVKHGAPLPLRLYREKKLETEVICNNCTLRYAVYGLFAYCPDCGLHNSDQILENNLDLALKELDLTHQTEAEDLIRHLLADSLENAVSAFDGFGRELTRVYSAKSNNPAKAENLSFQNLTSANTNIITLFGFDLESSSDRKEWEFAIKCFNKRHLLAHKMGIVDQKYIDNTNDPDAIIGRLISISEEEVRELVKVISKMGNYLCVKLTGKVVNNTDGETTK